MSLITNLFMYPSELGSICPYRVATKLIRYGLDPTGELRACFTIDNFGHLEPDIETLKVDPESELSCFRDMSDHGMSLCLTLASSQIYVDLLSAPRYSPPYVSLRWHRRFFNALSTIEVASFYNVLIEGFVDSGARYAMWIDDAPDGCEDRMCFVDGVPWIDVAVATRYGFGLRQVWCRSSQDTVFPLGPNYDSEVTIGDVIVRGVAGG